MRIGLNTGGGDCPGLNAAIQAVVRAAQPDIEVYGIRDSFNGLMSDPFDVWSLKDVDDMIDRGGTILGTTNKGDPFVNEAQKVKRLQHGMQQFALDGLIVIGGDGTHTISKRLSHLGVPIVGIPKTIDNDLAATDISIGFSTAVDIATEAISRLRSTAESHQRIMVLEVMGRDAGFIALHAGIAGGANAILIPEIPYDIETVCRLVAGRRAIGRMFSIVVVAEGAFARGSQPTYSDLAPTQSAQKHLGGISHEVADTLHQLTGMPSRVTILGHVQRGGSPNPYDRVLATQFGVKAIEMARRREFGYVLGLKKGQIVPTAYKDLAEINHPLQMDDPVLKAAEAVGICLGR